MTFDAVAGLHLDTGFRQRRDVILVRCYTCNKVFDIEKADDRREAAEHSRACHEMTLGFRA